MSKVIQDNFQEQLKDKIGKRFQHTKTNAVGKTTTAEGYLTVVKDTYLMLMNKAKTFSWSVLYDSTLEIHEVSENDGEIVKTA